MVIIRGHHQRSSSEDVLAHRLARWSSDRLHGDGGLGRHPKIEESARRVRVCEDECAQGFLYGSTRGRIGGDNADLARVDAA